LGLYIITTFMVIPQPLLPVLTIHSSENIARLT
jgi:hypothetical protein